jgi:hypothetical protein
MRGGQLLELSANYRVSWANAVLSETAEVKSRNNNELTKLIGRRLRDACEEAGGSQLPAAIAAGLRALQQAEKRLVDRSEAKPVVIAEGSQPSPNGAARR